MLNYRKQNYQGIYKARNIFCVRYNVVYNAAVKKLGIIFVRILKVPQTNGLNISQVWDYWFEHFSPAYFSWERMLSKQLRIALGIQVMSHLHAWMYFGDPLYYLRFVTEFSNPRAVRIAWDPFQLSRRFCLLTSSIANGTYPDLSFSTIFRYFLTPTEKSRKSTKSAKGINYQLEIRR